jgi:glutaredoxin 3
MADAESSDSDFLVYSTTFCPYCVAVKRFLTARGLTFTETNFDQDSDARSDVVSETGHRTVPVIIDIRKDQPVFIGGFDETQRYLA